MAVEDTPKPVDNEETNPNSIENPIDRYHEEGDDAEEGEIVGGEGHGDVDESSKSAVPQSHPLEHSWTFWFDNPSVKSKQTTWGSSLRSVFTFSTVEEFWSLYNNMRHPSKLTPGADFYCFKHNIEPKWEDPICANGGKWTMNFSKDKSDKSWLYTNSLIMEMKSVERLLTLEESKKGYLFGPKNASNEAAQVSIGKQWKEFLDYNNSIGFIIHEDAKKHDRNAKNAYTT